MVYVILLGFRISDNPGEVGSVEENSSDVCVYPDDAECMEEDVVQDDPGTTASVQMYRKTLPKKDAFDEILMEDFDNEEVTMTSEELLQCGNLKFDEADYTLYKEHSITADKPEHSRLSRNILEAKDDITLCQFLVMLFPQALSKFIRDYTEKNRIQKRVGERLEESSSSKSKPGTPSARNELKWRKTVLQPSRIFTYVALLILNMLHPHKSSMTFQWATKGTSL